MSKWILLFLFTLPFEGYTVLLPYIKQDCVGITVIPRKAWNAANQKLNLRKLKPQYVSRLMVHHTSGKPCTTKADCLKIIKNIETLEMKKLEIKETLMHFYIGGDGNMYEGRGWYTPDEIIPGYPLIVSIGFIGDYETHPVPAVMLEMWKKFLHCYVENNGPKHRVSGYYSLDSSTVIAAHGDLRCTKCPGKYLKEAILKPPYHQECQFVNPCEKQKEFVKRVEKRRQYKRLRGDDVIKGVDKAINFMTSKKKK